jgi:SAM-dependent methyltransferase
MPNILYSDLSKYYDLMCSDINYLEQSQYVKRMHGLFGNSGLEYLDLACGTGPHVRHFIDFGFNSSGLDINPAMLEQAIIRCPEGKFSLQDMASFKLEQPVDLITCFLYSVHYSSSLTKLSGLFSSAHQSLAAGGLFCFNAVDKTKIINGLGIKHGLEYEDSHFSFQSGWQYSGQGDRQFLNLRISKETNGELQVWDDQHTMVALDFERLQELLAPYFEVHIFEHDFATIVPWAGELGNAIFVCLKREL